MQTQRDIVLQLLNKSEWVCGIEFQQNYIPEYRTRINELRRTGLIVQARRCTKHRHRGVMQEWSLRINGTPPRDEIKPKVEQNAVQPETPRRIENTAFHEFSATEKIAIYEKERKRRGRPLTQAEFRKAIEYELVQIKRH